MKAVLLATAVFAVAALSAAQQGVPATSTITVTSTDTAGVEAANDAECSKEITIYIDLSGTMTQRDPRQTNINRVPLNLIAETLTNFLSAPGFLQPEDTVSVKFFGSIVQTQATGNVDAVQLLTRLANTATWRSVVNGVRETDFKKFTDFDRVFSDIGSVGRNSQSGRQIIFIASDFAYDDRDQPTVDNVTVRTDSFRQGLELLRPLLKPGGDGRITQLVGIHAPDPTNPYDGEVARVVREDLRAAGVNLYQYNEDTTEAAKTLRNYFFGAVTARPADRPGIRVGGDNRVAIEIVNPNCDPVVVTGLTFRVGDQSVLIAVTPTELVNGAKEVRVDVDRLASLWNQEVTATPELQPGTTARTLASDPFWLGNWVRINQMSPYLYPSARRTGNTLVVASVSRSARANIEIAIRGVEPGDRTASFVLPSGSGESDVVFAFSLTDAQARQLSAAGATAEVSGNGAEIITNNTSAASQKVPLAASVIGTTGGWIAITQIISWSLLAFLFVWITIVTFVEAADVSLGDQFARWFWSTAALLPSLATSCLLWIRFGAVPVLDRWVWSMVLLRAFLVFATGFLILRTILVVMGWRYALQRRLSPGNVAVARRRWANAAIWCLAFAAFIFIIYTFFWQSPAAPPGHGELVSGVLR
jgi:hypothetical protein